MLESLADDRLVEEVRQGNSDAWLVLWKRYIQDCRTSVASVLDGQQAVEASVRRSFARVLQEIRENTDPLASFGVYLRTTMLLDACLGSVERTSAAPVVRAFSDLSRLDQLLLWGSLVDNFSQAGLALLGSVPPDEIPERLDRARARLRGGWVFQLGQDGEREQGCPWVAFGANTVGLDIFAPRIKERWQRHLDQCPSCRVFAAEQIIFPLNLLDALLVFPRTADR